MALALVGGAFLSSFLNVLFDRMASRQVVDFIRGRKATKGLLKKLKIKLLSVRAVLDDAEEQQIRNLVVRDWLDELKDALYVAGDLLDEINTEALRRKLEGDDEHGSSSSTSQVLNLQHPISLDEFETTVEPKISEILERLELILMEKDVLGLKEGANKRQHARVETTSLVDDSAVYGRDGDKETVIKMLLSDDAADVKIGVIPFVGMGGIGKTTLAQFVYNDDRIKQQFDHHAWVCVSEVFDIRSVTQTLYESITTEACGLMKLDLLQVKLKEALTNKKFLFVLDDVWSESHADWDLLSRPFQYGAQGSKIIVTTRSEDVASVMGTLPAHCLKQMSEGDCWSLFAKHAFTNASLISAHPNLEAIGRKIVSKCKGLPLSAKSLGCLLRSKLNIQEWEEILNSDTWELLGKESKILPALWLSYHYLPPHLKRCFAYCSIFPKDYRFRNSELVLLWMAEDLLQPTKKKTMEEVGEDYLKNLISRSFFQYDQSYHYMFTMHDLMNDLAKFVSGEFCFRLEDDHSLNRASKTRHFSYMRSKGHDFEKSEGLYEARNLHTFLPLPLPLPRLGGSRSKFEVLENGLCHLLLIVHHLRVLNLSNYDIRELPSSISNLKHLRYLNLSETLIEKLPETVCSLYNLQTLLLNGCLNLGELPNNLVKLVNLRYLDITDTRLKKMPPGMSKLKDLQFLSDFVLDKRSGHSNIVELKELQHLHGALYNIVNAGDALEANIMKDKKYLDELALKWGGATEDTRKDREVLEKLQPHANLKVLEILGYGGTRFPNWFKDHSLSSLVAIHLKDCKFCWLLPPLGQLPCLRSLSIRGLNGVESIGGEFYGNCTSQPFRALKHLTINDMAEWKEWYIYSIGGNNEEEGGIFPSLCWVSLRNCPKLTEIVPLNKLVKLKKLELINLKSYSGSLSNVESKCPKFPSLCYLAMEGCPKFVCFPSGGMDAPNLKGMKIWDCEKVRSLPEEMHTLLPSLEELTVSRCPKVEAFPQGGFPSKLKMLDFNCSRQLFASRGQWGLQRLESLGLLKIKFSDECGEDDYSFPEEGLLPTTLTELTIFNLPKHTTLQCKELIKLISLEKLRIEESPDLKLESCPEGAFPSKLKFLEFNCSRQVFASRGHWGLQRLESLRLLRIMFSDECGDEDDYSFPKEGQLPATLTQLCISNLPKHTTLRCKELIKLISLEMLRIGTAHDLKLESCPEGAFPSTLKFLEFDCSRQVFASRGQWGLQRLESLRELRIKFSDECGEDDYSFPEDGLLPETLTSLGIYDLPNRMTIQGKELRKVISLEDIYISGCPELQCLIDEAPTSLKFLCFVECPKLECLSAEWLPTSLSQLDIIHCPVLAQRVQRETGEDWPKVAHIPRILVNGDCI